MTSLTAWQQQRAFAYLAEAGTRFPYGFIPGTRRGGYYVFKNEADWNAKPYNPPNFLAHLPEYAAEDADASPQPTWAQLETAAAAAKMIDDRSALLAAVDTQAHDRICAAYGAADMQEEVFIRLGAIESGTDISDKHTERARLSGKADALRTAIRNAATQEALDAIDPAADTHWARADTE